MKQHLLIIDSDTRELRKLRELLTRAGFSIMTASDWKTARQIYDKMDIAMVLCEGRLADGLESKSAPQQDEMSI